MTPRSALFSSTVRKRPGLVTLVICILFSLLPLLPTNVASAQERATVHVVQPGETLSGIAARYGVPLGSLARHNGLVNWNILRVGQRLHIPVQGHPSNTPAVVASPEPVRAVASPVTPVPAAASGDEGTDAAGSAPTEPRPTRVTTGVSSSCRHGILYTVRSTDSLHAIAARFAVPISAVLECNGLPRGVLYVGQRILVPRAAALTQHWTAPDGGP